MTADSFVPVGFRPPTAVTTDQFRLEPLGPQHNRADHAAWTSSIEHIRATPGFPHGDWPPPTGLTLAGVEDVKVKPTPRAKSSAWRRRSVRFSSTAT